MREQYGISQTVLARYLNITRSQLSMAEIERRNLPTEALLTILPLLNSINQPKTRQKEDKARNESTSSKKEIGEALTGLLKDAEYKLLSAERQLAKMKISSARVKQVLAQLPALRSEPKLKGSGLLGHIEQKALKSQKESNEISQLVIESQVQGLKAQIAYLKKRTAG